MESGVTVADVRVASSAPYCGLTTAGAILATLR